MRLDLFVKLMYESNTIGLILFVGIRYSMRDLLSDLNNYMPGPQTSDMCQIGYGTVNDVSASSSIDSSP